MSYDCGVNKLRKIVKETRRQQRNRIARKTVENLETANVNDETGHFGRGDKSCLAYGGTSYTCGNVGYYAVCCKAKKSKKLLSNF